MIKRFIIYGLTGWCLEVVYTGFCQFILTGDLRLKASTSIWMFFIYGLAIFLERIHNKLRSWPVIMRGGIYCILIYCTEYSTGYILRQLIGACPWEYSSSHAIDGLIQLDYIPIWFTLGLLFEKYHDFLVAKGELLRSQPPLKKSTVRDNILPPNKSGKMRNMIKIITNKIKPSKPDSNAS